jgi:two-component system sensor histidine kinase EvgS
VDDIDTNRELLKAYLAGTRLVISEADQGAAALECIARQRPDLILLDLKMPVMDGFEMARRLSMDPALAAIPIVAITASVANDGDGCPSWTNWAAFLRKPVSQEQLLHELARLLPGTISRVPHPVMPAKPWQERDASPSTEARSRWHELAGRLRLECVPEWRQLQRRLYVSRVAGLAERIADLAREYEAPLLLSWSEELKREADSFDLKQLRVTLAEFESLLGQIEGAAGDPAGSEAVVIDSTH